MTDIQPMPTQQQLLYDHQDITKNIRRIAVFLLEKLEAQMPNEQEFFRLMQKSDRASLTLQRLSSILCNVLPMEQNILGRRIELLPSNNESKLTAEDFQVIIAIAKQFDLLKDGMENKITDIIADLYAQEKLAKIDGIYGVDEDPENEDA